VNPSFEFDQPDRVTVGTVGEPGQRVFFVQAREGAQIVTLKVEKEHVRQLADHFAVLLEDLLAADAIPTDLDLEAPIEQDWIVGTIKVAPYDEANDRVHVLFEEFDPNRQESAEEAGPGAHARIALSREQVSAFVTRAQALLSAGRPPCPLCGNPMDPSGHACPRSNGHAG
jgi:uncharacterized repeat protein (TIGR03847 family)